MAGRGTSQGKTKDQPEWNTECGILERMLEERKKEKNEWDRDSEEPENSFPMGCERQ